MVLVNMQYFVRCHFSRRYSIIFVGQSKQHSPSRNSTVVPHRASSAVGQAQFRPATCSIRLCRSTLACGHSGECSGRAVGVRITYATHARLVGDQFERFREHRTETWWPRKFAPLTACCIMRGKYDLTRVSSRNQPICGEWGRDRSDFVDRLCVPIEQLN